MTRRAFYWPPSDRLAFKFAGGVVPVEVEDGRRRRGDRCRRLDGQEARLLHRRAAAQIARGDRQRDRRAGLSARRMGRQSRRGEQGQGRRAGRCARRPRPRGRDLPPRPPGVSRAAVNSPCGAANIARRPAPTPKTSASPRSPLRRDFQRPRIADARDPAEIETTIRESAPARRRDAAAARSSRGTAGRRCGGLVLTSSTRTPKPRQELLAGRRDHSAVFGQHDVLAARQRIRQRHAESDRRHGRSRCAPCAAHRRRSSAAGNAAVRRQRPP